jgi:hypothetical protein
MKIALVVATLAAAVAFASGEKIPIGYRTYLSSFPFYGC